MKVLVTFKKLGNIRFISHLDLQRLMRRAIKRGGLKIKYSQGFNPHAKLGMALPLGLGYESEAELMEIEFDDEYSLKYIYDALNSNTPEGVEVTQVDLFPENIKNIASQVKSCEYEIQMKVEEDYELPSIQIDEFLKQKEIIIEKWNKKKRKYENRDIKDKIISLKCRIQDGYLFELHCKSGSSGGLSPEQLMKSLCTFFHIDMEKIHLKFKRRHLNT